MPMNPDGSYNLYGFFNLGGTLSGRLSSNGPNLQNIPASGSNPAKARIAKMIKRCVKAAFGDLFCGLDFASLEDRISALTTKDPVKLKVYTDGYDGHCLRAHAYFGDQMDGIIGHSVASVNSIAKLYKPLRQMSKAPTFALTYQGTYVTLMNNCGFSEEQAKSIDAKYHELYVVSDQWVAAKIEQATKDGYVTCAFGLRVRTPLLKQVILGNRSTPFRAQAEGRTAGNALGQSYGMLNTRAASEFMKKVRASKYRLLIRPGAHIHDAQYYTIPDDLELLEWMNYHLVKAVEWQEDPAIAHDEVKLGGELSIFYPDWSVELELPNGASQDKIRELADEHILKFAA
jgi:DNA polymerase-1